MKKHALPIIVLGISLLALVMVASTYLTGAVPFGLDRLFSTASAGTSDVSGVTKDSADETPSIDFSQYQPDSAAHSVSGYYGTLPASASIEVPFIDQNPELPTGCEITSLAEVLKFYGFNADKEYLARNYLPKDTKAGTGCFIEYYYGSPWQSNGSGCFAPAIITAANNFLRDKGSELTATSLCYTSLETLLSQVASGYPVIVWTSFDYEADIEYTLIEYETGGSFYWPSYEHCTVLSGYDLEAGTVTLADPTYGIVTRSISDFEKYYQKMFYQALVVK